MQHADVIVIGAGIVGAACAHVLARQGLDVLVLDARLGGATAAGMGHLVVLDDNPAELALSQASVALWHAWGPRMTADQPGCAYSNCGTLWLAANDAEMAGAEEKARRMRDHGLACEMLDAAALRRLEPSLHHKLHGALKVSSDSIVYAPNAAQWLLQNAPRPIRFEQAEATHIDGGRVTLADGSWREAQAVVLAAGIHATRFCPELPIQPKKGHLLITDRYPGTVQHQLVELGYITNAHQTIGTSVAFNLQPRPTGQLLLGSSRQFDTTDPAVDQDVLAQMLRRALDYMPGLADLNAIRTWTGFRATTPDSMPIIGRHPTRDQLWLAVGHEGLGVTTAPATAELLAAQMTGGRLPLDPAPFAAQRFSLPA